MTASTIEDLTDAADLSLPDDVLIELDENGEMQGRGLYGYAWPDGSKITLYPDAFEDEEQLLRTLVPSWCMSGRCAPADRR